MTTKTVTNGSVARLSLKVIIAGLVLFSARHALAQKTLRWKFAAGQKLSQTMKQDMTMTMTAGAPMPIQSKVTQQIDMQMAINKVDAKGVADITQAISRVQMKMTAPGGMGFEFDTQQKKQPEGLAAMLGPALKSLVNARFEMKMNPQGEVSAVKLSDKAAKAMQRMPGMGGGGGINQDNLRNMARQGSPSFPKEAVSKGKSWKNVYDMKMPQLGTMKVSATMTYEGEEAKDGKTLDKIGVKTKMIMVPDPQSPIGANVRLKDHNAAGTIYFDNKAGRMTESVMKQQMTLEISMAGQQMEQKIDQNIQIIVKPAGE